MNWRAVVAVVVVAGAMVAGCQDDKPKLTLLDARAITDAETRPTVSRLTVSNRGAAEIIALLEGEKPAPGKVAQLQQIADGQPPPDAEPSQLAGFYFDRGNAASELGRQEQRLADLGRAAELTRQYGGGDSARILQELARAQMRAGRYRDAIATRKEEIDYVERNPSGINGRLFSSYSFMAITASSSGSMTEAQRWLDKAVGLLDKSASWKNDPLKTYGASWRASVLQAKATLALNTGRLAEAERLFGDAIAELDDCIAGLAHWQPRNLPPPGTFEQFRDALRISRALVIAREGRLDEAALEMLPPLDSQIKRRGHYSSETADAIGAYVELLLELGRGGDAERLAEISADIYQKVGHDNRSLSLAKARILHARALSLQHKDRQAVALFTAIENDLATTDRVKAERLVRGQDSYALSLVRIGEAGQAVPLLQADVAHRAEILGADAQDTAEARGILGIAYAATGDVAGALAAFRTAVPILVRDAESLGASGPPVRRVRLLTEILEAYLGLLADLTERGGAGPDVVAESFRVADIAHGSSVQQAIAANAARAAVNSPALAELVRREQDSKQRLAALRSLLAEQLAAPSDQSTPSVITELRRELGLLESAEASIDGEIVSRFPSFAELMRPQPASPRQIEAALAPGEALVVTYAGENRTFAWALSHGRPTAFASTAVTRAEINALVTKLRAGLDPLNESAVLDLEAAYRVYQIVLAPVAAGWADARLLTVVPDKALGQLPFSALVTEAPAGAIHDLPGQPAFSGYRQVPWLIRKMAVVQLPSASSLLTLRGNHMPSAPRPFIGFGDPLFNEAQVAQASAEAPSVVRGPDGSKVAVVRRNLSSSHSIDTRLLTGLPRLPDTADEVRAAAAVLGADPASDVILGLAANTRTVADADLASRRVVMFATHGLKANDIAGLTQPALALSSPKLAKVDGNGLLAVDDVLGLKLNADWVVLSACNTASPDGDSAEAISGLGRAFFYAGTRAVLVTSWAVETTSAAMLTAETFRQVANNPGLSRGEALRRAMITVMEAPGLKNPDTGKIDFSYAHPMFWAPYVLVGDGR